MLSVKIIYDKPDGGSAVEVICASSVQDDGEVLTAFLPDGGAASVRYIHHGRPEGDVLIAHAIYVTGQSGSNVHHAEGAIL